MTIEQSVQQAPTSIILPKTMVLQVGAFATLRTGRRLQPRIVSAEGESTRARVHMNVHFGTAQIPVCVDYPAADLDKLESRMEVEVSIMGADNGGIKIEFLRLRGDMTSYRVINPQTDGA